MISGGHLPFTGRRRRWFEGLIPVAPSARLRRGEDVNLGRRASDDVPHEPSFHDRRRAADIGDLATRALGLADELRALADDIEAGRA